MKNSVIITLGVIAFILTGYFVFNGGKPLIRTGSQDVVDFKGKIINIGDNFIIGDDSSPCVSREKFKIVNISKNSLGIRGIERDNFEHKFVPIEELVSDKYTMFMRDMKENTVTVKKNLNVVNNTCIYAVPLCTDMGAAYCFTLSREKGKIFLDYDVSGWSTFVLSETAEGV